MTHTANAGADSKKMQIDKKVALIITHLLIGQKVLIQEQYILSIGTIYATQ